MNTKKEEIYLIDIQIIASIIFILTIIVNIFLSFNRRNILINNEGLISNKDRILLQRLNRIIVLCLLIIYLYIAYRQSVIDKIQGKDLRADYIEIFVSILSVIGGLLVLYEIYTYDNNEANIESPNL